MNISKHLILINNDDLTADIKFCNYNRSTKKYEITFLSGMSYFYNYDSVEWVRNPEILSPAIHHVYYGEKRFFNIEVLAIFHARNRKYCYIRFSNGSEYKCEEKKLKIVKSCLSEESSKNCINYLREISSINEIKSWEGEVLLKKQYEKLDFVGGNTAMALYLNPIKNKPKKYRKTNLIFPFGGNASQFKAVEAAMENQISVIQGPPGTGKTQTILNVIANLLITGKSVQIVSNNNSATENILEKLAASKYNMDFLVAPLGNRENKKIFIQNQEKCYPNLSTWKKELEEQIKLENIIKELSTEVAETFAKQERFSLARLELDSLLLEIKYFKEYCNETHLLFAKISLRSYLNSERLMKLWQECYAFSEKESSISVWFKIKSVFIYRILDWKFYENKLPFIITFLQNLFYEMRKAELEKEVLDLKEYLKVNDAKRKMDELTRLSMDYLRARLFDRYGNTQTRKQFQEEDTWKNPDKIIKEYPIVLSTTFSSRSCLKGAIYDYIIMDEASQVDIATGALALSSAKNAVIVGDLKQLPNVVKEDMKKRCDAIFESYKLHQGYSFSENSFLKSVCSIFPEIKQTLLREHYRCHPKIIGFCNQKFYNNELVIMTEDYNETDTLSVFKTNIGNHRRDHINQRQIEVAIKEALPIFKEESPYEIGIIAPYKDQVTAITKQLKEEKIEVHTVHKFQGREKDAILLTIVDDVVTDFSDDPYLLNVAVSRAKKKLCIVTSGNEQPKDSNVGDLIDYILYHNFNVVESKVYSVFDLLYQQYTDARIAFLKKHKRVSVYDSENLMYGLIMDVLKSREQLSLNVICHQPLNMLIRDPKYLSEEECQYVMNNATHLDFLIYNRINKKPVLAIEVDGFHNHKEGTVQYKRDRMKDQILKNYEIPLLRFSTTESEEKEKIEQVLDYL